MTANPKCMLCRGTGRIETGWPEQPETSCACSALPPLRSEPVSPGWSVEALGAVLARAAEQQRCLDEHRATCTDRPCARCERFVCRCGAPVDVVRRCDACELAASFGEFARGLPERFRWALAGDVAELGARVQASAELIRRGLLNPPGHMVLIGPSGAGKTSLAVAMLGAWVRKAPAERAKARFAEAFELAGARARHPLGQGEAPEVAAAMTAPMLLLDDLGSERDDRNAVLSDVLQRRHNADLPTWVTTWLEPEQCAERYGGAVTRRLFEPAATVRLGARVKGAA